MRKNFLTVLAALIFCSSFQLLGLAQERTMAPVVSGGDSAAVSNLPLIIKGEGQLMPKAGTVFTDGGHYENTLLPYLASTPEAITYPRWAVRQGWQGKFSIALEILTDGSVGRVKVMKSTGHKMLDDSATAAVSKWKFHPAMQNGKPIVTCIQIPIVFQLDNE